MAHPDPGVAADPADAQRGVGAGQLQGAGDAPDLGRGVLQAQGGRALHGPHVHLGVTGVEGEAAPQLAHVRLPVALPEDGVAADAFQGRGAVAGVDGGIRLEAGDADLAAGVAQVHRHPRVHAHHEVAGHPGRPLVDGAGALGLDPQAALGAVDAQSHPPGAALRRLLVVGAGHRPQLHPDLVAVPGPHLDRPAVVAQHQAFTRRQGNLLGEVVLDGEGVLAVVAAVAGLVESLADGPSHIVESLAKIGHGGKRLVHQVVHVGDGIAHGAAHPRHRGPHRSPGAVDPVADIALEILQLHRHLVSEIADLAPLHPGPLPAAAPGGRVPAPQGLQQSLGLLRRDPPLLQHAQHRGALLAHGPSSFSCSSLPTAVSASISPLSRRSSTRRRPPSSGGVAGAFPRPSKPSSAITSSRRLRTAA